MQLLPTSTSATWSPDSPYPSLAYFQLCHPIGQGAFGKVWLSRCRQSGSACAVKVVSRKAGEANLHAWRQAQREVECLKQVDFEFPFISQLYASFANEKYLFMVMQFQAGGNLRHLIKTLGSLPENPAKLYVAELGLALDHLQSKNILFRDLKTCNILIGSDGHLKLTDFGLSKIINHRTSSFSGSPHIMAPEVFAREKYGFTADWYSLGVCMYEMLSGEPPFAKIIPSPRVLAACVTRGEVDFPESFSRESVSLLNRLFQKNPEERLGTLDQLQPHPWFHGLDWERVYKKDYVAPFTPLPSQAYNLDLYPSGFYHHEALEYEQRPLPQITGL